MILLCGIPSEEPISLLNQALLQKGAHVVVFSQRQFENANIDWGYKNKKASGRLELFNCSYSLDSFSAVYTRFMNEAELPEFKDANQVTKEHCHAFHDSFFRWLEVTDSCVVNKHSKMFSNSSKPYQAQIIRQYGLKIPPTIITNDVRRVNEFQVDYKKLIYKSISGVRSIVREFGPNDEDRLSVIRYCPVQFQAKLEGYDVRVHVIGSEAIATKVITTGTDYRYAAREGGETKLESFELPPDVAKSCVELTAALGLHFSGIDLLFSDSDGVFCFEVNPMPGYSYYEINTGQLISRVLADYLLR